MSVGKYENENKSEHERRNKNFRPIVISSFHQLTPWRGVRRPSVCLSVCKHFAQIATSRRQMAGSPPNLHTMVPRRAYTQGVLKFEVEVKGHLIPAHLEFHKNR